NLDQESGLYNGTQLQVTQLMRTSLAGYIVMGLFKGGSVSIPRIRLTLTKDEHISLLFMHQ
ncbi:hypothetical protein BDK51DRAFT_19276, partial [Blyttiomyces helicus]